MACDWVLPRIVDKQGEKPETQNKEPDPPNPVNMSKHTFVHLSQERQTVVVKDPTRWLLGGDYNPEINSRQSTYLTLLDMRCYSVQYIGVTTWKVGTHSYVNTYT